jgi:transposase
MSTDAELHVNPAELPDDPAFLKPLIVQLFESLQKSQQRVQQLEHHMDLLLRRVFGRTSEQLDPRQLVLAFGASPADAAPSVPPAPPAEPEVPATNSAKKPKGHGRRRTPDTLVHVEQLHDLTDEQKQLLGGAENLVLIGEETSEQYEWEPSSLFVIVHRQQKYARREQRIVTSDDPLEQNVIVAAKPPQPLPGSEAGPGLLAHVLVSKYHDHLPLHRQERILGRHGVRFSRQTMCDWCAGCAKLFDPLVSLIRSEVLASHVLHTDDTPIKIRDAHAKEQLTGRIWTYVGDETYPFTFFDFTRSRERDGPARVLANFRGYLQADAFSAYDGIYFDSRGAIQEVACWAHARRKFFESRDSDLVRANIALARIGQLYELERGLTARRESEWRDLPLAARAALIATVRQQHARPILAEFRTWLDEQSLQVLPKSPLAIAIRYTLNQWDALCRYTDDGQLAIDNNAAERSLRGLAIGRRNWLFVGSEQGGHTAATILTLIASATRHSLDPFAYLRDLLSRLPTTADTDLVTLLPNRWQPI